MTRPREQAVLARLALSASRTVPVETLVADVWGDEPPPTSVDALRVHVSNLRKLLTQPTRPGSEVLRTASGGYRLDVPEADVDVNRFEQACQHGRLDLLRAALDARSDHDLGRLDAGSGFFDAAAHRIDDMRLRATETLAQSDITTGRADRAVPLLQEAAARAPYRERLWELQILALAAADRRAEALRAFQRARVVLAEIGIEPGPGLVAAEAAALDGHEPRPVPSPTPRRPVADYVEVEGSRVAFATLGAGMVDLLFLHGGFVPFDIMGETPRLARFLDELAARCRVVLLDRRGIGMSDPPAGDTPVVLDHWVADCRAVLDAVGSRQAIVLGHEHGGPVAIRLAAEYPDRVRGLVLHSTAAHPLRSHDHPYGPSEKALDRIDRMIDRLPGAADVLSLVAPSAGDDAELRAWLDRAGRLGAGPTRAHQLHRTYLHADVRDRLRLVAAPTVVLHPARLVGTDPGQARYLADNLPDAELHLLDSADHVFWLADAGVVMAAIDRLLARITATPSGPSARLRALVAVAPPDGAGVLLATAGAEVCLELAGAVVAAFPSLSAAQDAAHELRLAEPGAVIVVDVADTTGGVDDAAVVDMAQRVSTTA